MNNYEQLKGFLNKCIELWWSYSFLPRYLECKKEGLRNWEHPSAAEYISYHTLFSKDSGLMEFVNWANDGISNQITVHWITVMDYDVKYNYMVMWEMTAKEKIEYFLENALLPTKQD